jgi:hypothetical protein
VTYLTNPSCLIEKHQLGTGWYSEQERPPISPLSPREPPPTYDSPTTESSDSNPTQESDEDIAIRTRINYDDEVLASRAELFTTQEPIEPETITLAEAMDCMEYTTPDHDYDPGPVRIALVSTAITLPAQTFQVGQPGSGNVFLQGSSGGRSGGGIPGGFPTGGGGGGGGGGPPTPTPAPAAAAAAAPAQNNDPRSLFGSAPPIFDGSRDKSDDFVQAFELYRAINQLHPVMANPYNRVMMCLSYMKGPKVNDWVRHKARTLQAAIDNRTTVATDETIWQAFEDEFVAAFTDTTRHEQVMLDLINISMKGDDLDTYMATFKHL